MKPINDYYFDESLELDNIYNETDDHYYGSDYSSIWYN